MVINFLQASILRATQRHLLSAAPQLAEFIASSSALASMGEDKGPVSRSVAGSGGTSTGTSISSTSTTSTTSTSTSTTSANTAGCNLQASPHFYGCNTTWTLEKAALTANLLDRDGGASHALPPPLLLASADRASSMCKLDEELKDLLMAGSGWEWVDEGRHGNHKWGFVANQSGSWLELQLSTTLTGMATGNSGRKASRTADALSSAGGASSANRSQAASSSQGASGSQAASQQQVQPAHLAIIFLRSYEHMGTAKVTCIMGCTCPPTTIDGHWETKASQSSLQPLLNVSQSKRCVLKIEVEAGTRSGGHKVKIMGVVLGSQAMSQYEISKFSAIHLYASGGRYTGRRRLHAQSHVVPATATAAVADDVSRH